MADVLCMGELLIDFVAAQDDTPLSQVASFTRQPGGAPANVAVAVQRLGLPAGFIGSVGADPFGDYLRSVLDASGVDTAALFTTDAARTTLVFAGVWTDGRKDMCFYRSPGADMMLQPDAITPALFAGARALHYGSIGFINEPTASAQHKAIRLAEERGLMLTYDPNYRADLWPDEETARLTLQSSFKHAHIAKISQEEWAIATGYEEIEAGVQAVLAQGVELVIISRGECGAIATNGTHYIEVPALQGIDVVETTGAGDAFMGAMIAQLLPRREALGTLARLEADELEAALRFANVVGGLACTKPGAIPALPTRAEVDAFIAERGLPR